MNPGVFYFAPFLQPAVPVYQLSRTIQNVPELWREWASGFGNQPSVQSFESLYGAAWRPDAKDRVLFSRRKVIVDEIYAREADGVSLETAVEEVELVRSRGKFSLYKLSQLLPTNRTKSISGRIRLRTS